jgi:hypothetical protein
MGGRLLAKFGARRLQTEEYMEVQNNLISQLEKICDLKFFTIPQCSDKLSHGDIDICVDESIKNIRTLITSNFVTNGTGQNDDIFSFVFQCEFQVDIICSPFPEFARNSLAYNDIISVVFGSICKMNGLKLRKNGLFFINPITNNDILVTSRWDDVLNLFGIDEEIVNESKEGVFQFVCSTPFFNRARFIHESLRKTNIRAKRKRPIQNEFLNYVRQSQNSGGVLSSKVLHHKLLSIDGFSERLDDDNMQHHNLVIMNNLMKTKFSSEMIINLTGLKGKELGDFIKRFKRSKGEDFHHWLNISSEDQIRSDIISFKKESFHEK